jgi:osmotically inducible protein OsmC
MDTLVIGLGKLYLFE